MCSSAFLRLPDVQRIAVGEEGHAAELLHHIGNGACIVGTQEGEVPQLTKVNLDGDKLVLEVDLLNASTANEALELVELALAAVRAQIGVDTLAGSDVDRLPWKRRWQANRP